MRFHVNSKGFSPASGLAANELNCLLDDPEEPVMWVGTQRAGLDAYNYKTQEFLHYRHRDDAPYGIRTDEVTGLSKASNGGIWVSTYWGGVDLLDRKSGKFSHYNTETVKGFVDDKVWCAYDDGMRQLYVGHVSNGFSVVDIKKRQAVNFTHDPNDKNSLSGNEVRSLLLDKKGNVWVGTDRGLDLYHPRTKSFTRLEDAGRLTRRIFDIKMMGDGRLWMATELGGVAILENPDEVLKGGNPQFKYLPTGKDKQSVTANSVRSLLEDRYDNVWIGLYDEGLDFLSYYLPLFRQINYSVFGRVDELTAKSALDVCQSPDGKLYVGTDGGGINVLDEHRKRIEVIRIGKSNSVQATFCDDRGRIWIGTFLDGAYIYHDGKKAAIPGLGTGKDVRCFYQDRNGDMWVGTNEGAYLVDKNTLRVKKHISPSNRFVRTIADDEDGRLWIGTFGGGLSIYSKSLQLLRKYEVANGFPSNTVNHLTCDRHGRVWVCTAEGLACFSNDKQYRLYDKKDGLENAHVRAAVEDGQGNVRGSTYRGVSCLVKGSESFLNYSYDDNIPLGNFTSHSVCVTHRGEIVFGSNNGLCYFDPQRVLRHDTPPPVFISSIAYFDGKSGKDSVFNTIRMSQVSLTYQQDTFTVTFGSGNFAMSDMVDFAYRLKGVQDNWTVTDGHDITFYNIPPGDYRVEVKCRLRNQEWSDNVAAVSVYIAPPLWLTWWAKLLYLLVALTVVWLLFGYYNRNLKRRYQFEVDKKKGEQAQRLRLAGRGCFSHLTHELRTPLTLILGPMEDLMNEKGFSAKVVGKIQTMRNSVVRLSNLVNRVLEFRKVDIGAWKLSVGRGNIVAVVREIFRKYEELNRNTDVKFVFKSSPDIINVFFDKEVVLVIIDNLVSNAMKYTERGQITVGLSLVNEGHTLEMVVADTGVGITQEAVPRVFDPFYRVEEASRIVGTGIGLALVKRMVDLHQGEITVESTPEKGTTFKVCLSADNTYGTKEVVEHTAEMAPSQAIDGKTVMLLVDDNLEIVSYISESFSEEFTIMTAQDGRQGLKIALQSLPAIIISDVMMPYMDGLEMCRKLKSDVRTNHIPVIILTAKDSVEMKEEGYACGADSYITKPFVRALLEARVKNLLGKQVLWAQSETGKKQEERKKKRVILREVLDRKDRAFLEQIDMLIQQGMANEVIDINYLSLNMAMSGSTLYRKMKTLTGLSANEYIRKYKMKCAEKLLIQGKGISETGFMVGMNTPSYFRKCFKEEFGVTPSEYINRLTESE